MKQKIKFSEQEFLEAIKNSFSHKEAMKKLGYKNPAGYKSNKYYYSTLIKLNPDISHFTLLSRSRCIKDSGSIEAFYRLYERCAIKRKIDFKLTLNEFEKLVTQKCFYCGQNGDSQSSCKTKNKFCGLDRVKNDIGYISTNIVTCCKTCNYLKRDFSEKIFLNKIKEIYENLKLGEI